MRLYQGVLAGAALLCPAVAASAQSTTVEALSAELAEARAEIGRQRQQLQAQELRLQAIEGRFAAAAGSPQGARVVGTQVSSAAGATGGVETVGQAPEARIQMPEVAVLGDQGSIITRAGQLTAELGLEYARADRNRAIFRGIEVVESVLIGVFDINESRQDILTAAAGLRYGLSDRFEVGVRLPFVHRSDKSVLTPVAGSTGDDPAATRDSSASGNGVGDLELSARYQIASARRGLPFLITNLLVVAPIGSNPFEVRRDAAGLPLEAATGAGFWGVSPSLTAILPSDPAVLFGTLGYTRNFARNVSTSIGDVIIDRVDPGDALSVSAGLGISLNQRTSFNLGYAHSWVFGTKTLTRLADGDADPVSATSRDLQLGRLLFGVTYRVSNQVNLNWAVEVGATEDATDLRAVLRIPVILWGGR
ncbi:MAG TPA: transporter [Allosphingosinicella sp.]|jgi:uncharacterized coiled-coil protein SlyX